MSGTNQSLFPTVIHPDPVESIVQHLLHRPSDLVDTSRLLRRFRASAEEFQQALNRLEKLTDTPEGEEAPN